MAAISLQDWGRIYARIWLDEKTVGKPKNYKERFEKDPAVALKEITEELGISNYDRILDVNDPPGEFSKSDLEGIINGTNTNFCFFMRLTC